MSQEFESRVNELVVARNLPYNEAAEIVTKELAEEGVEETQKKNDTNSEPSGGSFNAIEQPSLPLTSWQTNQIAEHPEFEEDIINTDYTAVDQAEVDALNTEYQARVDKYNSDFNAEATKLIDVLSETQEEEYGDVYSRFQEETGVPLDEGLIEEITALAVERKDSKVALDKAYKESLEESKSTGSFEPLQDFYQGLGYDEEEVKDIEAEWIGKKDRAEAIGSAFEFSPNPESFVEDISSLNLDPEREQELVDSYTKFFNEAGDAMFNSSVGSVMSRHKKARKLERKAKKIAKELNQLSVWENLTQKKGTSGDGLMGVFPDAHLDYTYLGTESSIGKAREFEQLMMMASKLRESIEQSRDENKKVRDLSKAHPVAVRSAFSLIAAADRQFLEGASEDVLNKYYEGDLTFEEAVATQFNRDYYESQYSSSVLYPSGVYFEGEDQMAFIPEVTPLSGVTDTPIYGDETISIDPLTGKEVVSSIRNLTNGEIEAVVQKKEAYLKEEFQKLSEGMSDEEKAVFEEIINERSGMPMSLRGDKNFGGRGLHLSAFADFIGGLADIPGIISSAPVHLAAHIDYKVAMSRAKTEEEKEDIKKRYEGIHDKIEFDFDSGGRKWAESISAFDVSGKGAYASFKEGDLLGGLTKSANLVGEMAPDTVAAMGMSLLTGGTGTLVFLYTNSMVRTYNAVRDEEWYKDLEGWQRGLFLNGMAILEAFTEKVATGAQLRMLSGPAARALGETRRSLVKRRLVSGLGDISIDTGMELVNTIGQAGIEYKAGGRKDFEGFGDELMDVTIASAGLGGTTSMVGAVNSKISASLSSSTDINKMGAAKFFRAEMESIINSTEPNSKEREIALNALNEDMGVVGALQLDAFEFHQFIGDMNAADGIELLDNSLELVSITKQIEASTSNKEKESLKLKAEKIVAERAKIEAKYLKKFAAQEGILEDTQVSNRLQKLNERASIFEAHAKNLESKGMTAQAESMRKRAERVRNSAESFEVQMELIEKADNGEVLSSEGRNTSNVTDKIVEMGLAEVVVDAELAAMLEKRGYKKVEYSGSGPNQFLMVDSNYPVTLLNPQSTSFKDAKSEIVLNRIVDGGSINEEFRSQFISELANMTRRGANETDLFNKAFEMLSKDEKAKVKEISERKIEDIEDLTKNPEAVLADAAAQSLDVLSKAFSGTKANVISDLDLARKMLEGKNLTPERREQIKQEYLSGRQAENAFYSEGEIFLTERATSKDIVEEYAHAYIKNSLDGFDATGQQLRSELNDIMKSDQVLVDAVNEKMSFYKERYGFSGIKLMEEKYVEIIAAYVANEKSLKASTIDRMTQLFAKIFPSFTESGGNSKKVLDKLSKSLREGNSQDISDQFDELFKLDSNEQSKVDDAQQVPAPNQKDYSASRRPTFLDNKKVTYTKSYASNYDAISRQYGSEQSYTFKDYFHFVNWYRKMTGNGLYTRIGRMTYVDDNGNTKLLKAPKPLLDKNTGEPIRMEPAMKSMQQSIVDRNRADRAEREERRLSAIKSRQLAKDQLWDVMKRFDPMLGGGNANLIIDELMSDFTPLGVKSATETNRFGQPLIEKLEGSAEYHEALFNRVNDYVQDNYSGETILYSAAFRRSIGEASDMKPAQKRKLLEDAVNKTKDFLLPETLAQINLYMDQVGEGKIGSGLPAHLAQQMYFAMLIQEAQVELILNGNDLTQNKEDMDRMSEVVTQELIFVNEFLNKNPREFYKNFYAQVSSTKNKDGSYNDPLAIQFVGKSNGPNGDFTVDNPRKLELARKHKDLLIAIVAVTSNGNRAVPNLSESLRIYSAVLEDLLQTPGKNPSKVDFARTKLIIESMTSKGFKASQYNGQRSALPIAVSLKKLLNIDGVSKGRPHYRFEAPSTFKRAALKKTGENRIAIQDSLGDWSKVGAFMGNLYQDNSVVTQDRHLVNYIDSRYRPSELVSFQVGDVLSILRKFEYEKIDAVQKEWMVTTTDGSTVYDLKKVAKWVKGNMGAKTVRADGTVVCMGGKSGGDNLSKMKKKLRSLYDNHMRQKGSAGNLFESNIEVVDSIVEQLRKKKGYKSVTRDEVMQMIFAANHVLPQAIGVSNRLYDDFSQETFEKAMDKAQSSVVEQGTPAEMLSRFTKDPSIEESFKGRPDSEKLQAYIDKADLSEAMGQFLTGQSTEVTMFSTKKVLDLSAHPQSRSYNLPGVFKGRNVKSMQNVKFGTGRIDIDKLLEGRASEANIKGRVSEDKPSDQFEDFVEGVVFMRHPLHGDSFVDSYGNIIKSAEQVYMSGDMIIASGKVRYAGSSIEKGRRPENINIENPEHFQAFDNFMSIMKQRNQSLANESHEMFEMAYKSLTPKERARFAKLTIDEHGNVIKGRRLRGTSRRVAESSEFGRFKNEIISNPENYIDKQNIAAEKKNLEELSPQELISLMRGDALDNLATRNDDVGVLAGIELINRLEATGNDIGIAGVLDRLAAMGTTAGRILRHMAELKTSTPQGMANVIIKKAEAQGKILSEDQKNRILDATKEYMDAYRKAQDLLERGIAGENVEDEFKEARKALNETQTKLDTLANKYTEKSWSEIGTQLVQGNLLTMMSQARNVLYNLANIIPKTIIDITSMPTSKAFELLGLHKEKRKLSLAGYLYAMRKFGAGAVEAMEQVITGREEDMSEWRMSRGFMPIRSLMAAMSSDLPEGSTLRSEINQRAKLLVQGTFGIPAETMFRLLSLGDVPFRRFAEGLELYSIARGKGLEGAALAQFLKFPDRASQEEAAREGRKLTFQEPMGLAKGSMWVIDNMAKGMGKAFENVKGFDAEGFFKFLIRLNVPYVSTIANFTEETLTYASPVVGIGKMSIQISNKDYTEASKTLSKVMVGQVISTSALYLISQGLLSGSVDWEDDEKTNLMYDTFPPNSINVSGLRRLLKGGDPSPQAGDEFRSYQTLGVFGTIMGSYAHSTTPEAAREMAEQPFSGNNAIKKLFGFDNVSVVAYMMDQSFLQGLNGITNVISSTKDPDDFEKAFFRYVETISKAFSSMFLPNALSGLDQSSREFLPDKRDVDLADRIKNHVRERTFDTGGLPVKVNWKGERIDQAPVGGNQFAYYMFDATKKREASQDEVSIEILNLYLSTGVLTKVVGTPYYASSVYRKVRKPSVRRGKAKKAYEALGVDYQFLENPEEEFDIRLTAEEINKALEMTNAPRYNEVKAFMQTENYKSMTEGERIEALDEINDNYKSLLSYNLDGSFMEHSKYILELMESRYLEQYGQD